MSYCQVVVNFTPTAPGLRMGAVNLTDSNGKVLATEYVSGTGMGPAIAFLPAIQSIPYAPPVAGDFIQSVAVDLRGNLFVLNNNGYSGTAEIDEIMAGSTQAKLFFSNLPGYPVSLAIDAAGNLLIPDPDVSSVLRVPPGCSDPTCATTVGTGLKIPLGVAVDGAGDVFIADGEANNLIEVPVGCTTSDCQVTVAGGFSSPSSVAVDGANNLFVADTGNSRVVEIPNGCTTSSCQMPVGAQLNGPVGVAVDAAGNVFISDTYNNRVVEVPLGCGDNSCQIVLASNLSDYFFLAVNETGDVFIGASELGLIEVARSQPPTLTYVSTAVGATSSDSPMSVQIQNIGNQPPTSSAPGASVGNNFALVSGSGTPADCTNSFSLSAGAICNLSISFTPQAINTINSSALLTDNALNVSGASQSISLNGVGTGATPTITFTTASSYVYGQSVQLTASSSAGDLGAFTYSLALPPPQAATVSSSGAVVLLGVGTVAVQVNQAAYGNYAAGSASAGFSITKAGSSASLSGSLNSNSTATLIATVTPLSAGNYPYGPSSSVSFYDGGTLLATVALSGSTATYTTTALTGAHSFTAIYNGDANFTASAVSNTASFTMATIIFTTAGSYVYGQSVQLTASSSAGDLGAFTYSLALPPPQAATVSSSGVVTLLGVGNVAVQVNQAAYGNFTAGSASAGFSITKAASLASLNGLLNSNSTATLTATVAPLTAGTYPYGPTNTVSFYDGGTLLATVALSGSTATYTTAALANLHNFTAIYNGDANFTASAVSNTDPLAFTVAPTINFTTAATYAYGQTFQAAATSSQGDAGAFTYSTTSAAATVTTTGLVSHCDTG